MNTAVLFLIFNRPDTTTKVFEAIRRARPPRLYIAADGARAGRPDEAQRCAEARCIATQVDWPCEVKTLFREANLGCQKAVSGGINWFFENEEQGIILEDDCLPDPSFFGYCDELLNRYRDDPRVMCITGDNFVTEGGGIAIEHSYYFSKFNHIWGWATWRRAWAHYDVGMKDWSLQLGEQVLKDVFPDNAPLRRFWVDCFSKVAAGEIDTWDYQWDFTCWRFGGLTCAPTANLISNVGFGAGATHTVDAESKLANLQTSSLPLPLVHPPDIRRNVTADNWSGANLFPLKRYSARRVLGRRLKALLRGQ